MKILKGKVAVVTGAASGIGRSLAIQLAQEGCHLALSDINREELAQTKNLIGSNVDVSTHIVDVSDQEAMIKFASTVYEHHKAVDLIINNAGVALCDFIDTVPIQDFQWIMNINFWGVVYGTSAFLPYLKQRPEAHIVNISSINGIVPGVANGPYCASKYAVKGYTETLYQELYETPIHVSCVHPGGVKTNILRSSRFNIAPGNISKESLVSIFDEEIFKTSATQAAITIISGIKKNNQRILVGSDAKVLDILARVFPKFVVKLGVFFARRLVEKHAPVTQA